VDSKFLGRTGIWCSRQCGISRQSECYPVGEQWSCVKWKMHTTHQHSIFFVTDNIS
jgi:hypothetical protein